MTNEFITDGPDRGEEPVGIETRFTQLWESGDRMAALEAVMGRRIDTSNVNDSRNFITILMQPTASEAYAAALFVKTLKEMAAEK
jgi:hypothetical protein